MANFTHKGTDRLREKRTKGEGGGKKKPENLRTY